MDQSQIEYTKGVIEAILFVSDKPVTVEQFKQVLPEVAPSEIERTARLVQDDYAQRVGGMTVVEVAGGYQMLSNPSYASFIRNFYKTRTKEKLSRPSLETLAIIAYKQPVSRADIEIVRGVNSDGVMAHLLSKALVKIVGRKEVPGRPFLYGTTKEFLEYFGLKSLEDLPKLEEFPLLAAAGDNASSVATTEAGEISPGATAETVEEEQKVTASLDAFEAAAEHEGQPSTENSQASS
jgi:segregation and condensation protein B